MFRLPQSAKHSVPSRAATVSAAVVISPSASISSLSQSMPHVPHRAKLRGPTSSNVLTLSSRWMSLGALSTKERKRLRRQRDGRNIFIPAYVNARDLSHRLGVTLLQLHKAGSTFFPWWPRASEKQLKKDGFSMLRDLILRFDECAVLCKRLGNTAVFEHTGLERIRNEHYALVKHISVLEEGGAVITPQMRQKLGPQRIGMGTGPRPIPEHERPSYIQPKQPVVCIVGHVDHGKTTLLDYLRGTFVAAREDAGITQDLYSYQAHLGDDVVRAWGTAPDYSPSAIPSRPPLSSLARLEEYEETDLLDVYSKVTFLDTPGHASFFDMRENGVLFCDLTILVVSAVDGVCPQTLESIEYIKTFKTPVVVALTKCDLPEAKPLRVAKQLRDAGLFVLPHNEPGAFDQLLAPEKGRRGRFKHQIAPYVCVSALKDMNMDQFRKALMKVFMTVKPQCDTLAPPVGLVLEALNEEGGRGRVLRVLLSSGTLSPHDAFVSGIFAGKVKDVRIYGDVDIDEFRVRPTKEGFPNNNREQESFDPYDHILSTAEDRTRRDRSLAPPSRKPKLGARVQLAVPGVPVEIMGCEGLPQAGDDMRVVPDELLAKTVAETRRFEMEYPEQARFTLGGLKPHPWTPPPLVFLDDMKKDRDLLLRDIDEDAITNLQVGDSSGVVQDVDTDAEAEEMVESEKEDEELSEGELEAMQHDYLKYQKKDKKTPKNQYESFYDEDEVVGSEFPNWDVIHGSTPEYERPFVVKAGTAGYLRMITDSIKAFNETFPEHRVSIVHSSIGSLNENDITKAAGAVDEDIDPNMQCPILLFRTRTPPERMLKKAKEYETTVYEYAVFDDMIKHMIGVTMFNKMFHNSQNLRFNAPGESFVEEPLDTPDTVDSDKMKKMKVSGKEKVSLVRSSLMAGRGKKKEKKEPEELDEEAAKAMTMSPVASLLPPLPVSEETYNPVVEKATEVIVDRIQQMRKPVQVQKKTLRGGLLSSIMQREDKDKDLAHALKVLSENAAGQPQVQAAEPAAHADVDDAISQLEQRLK